MDKAIEPIPNNGGSHKPFYLYWSDILCGVGRVYLEIFEENRRFSGLSRIIFSWLAGTGFQPKQRFFTAGISKYIILKTKVIEEFPAIGLAGKELRSEKN